MIIWIRKKAVLVTEVRRTVQKYLNYKKSGGVKFVL